MYVRMNAYVDADMYTFMYACVHECVYVQTSYAKYVAQYRKT